MEEILTNSLLLLEEVFFGFKINAI